MSQHVQDPQVRIHEGMCMATRWYEEGPPSWGAYAPDLLGLGAAADSRAEVEVLIAEVIPLHLASLCEDRAARPWLYTPDQLSPELRAVFARIDAA